MLERKLYACEIMGGLKHCAYYFTDKTNVAPAVDEFVLVENLDSYALAKVVGIVETDVRYEDKFTHGFETKDIICLVDTDKMIRDYKNRLVVRASQHHEETLDEILKNE